MHVSEAEVKSQPSICSCPATQSTQFQKPVPLHVNGVVAYV